jgi:hypothetical protein
MSTSGFDIQNKVRYFNFWSDLKPFIDGTSASLAYNWSYTNNNEYYFLSTEPYVGFNYVCYIQNTSSAERTDFETNWKYQPLKKSSGSFYDVRLVSSSLVEIGNITNPIWITGSVTTTGGSGGGGGTVTQGNAGAIAQSWYVQLTNGTTTIGNNQTSALFVTGNVTASISGTATITGSVSIVASPSFGTNGGSIPLVGNLIGGTSTGTDFRVLSTDNTGKLNVNATVSNPSLGGTGSLSPVTASLIGLRDLSGNLRAATGDNNGSQYVSFQESTATGTLGSLNATITIALSGSTSAGLHLAAGSLIGTLIAEFSYDNGTTWFSTNFFDINTKGLSNTISTSGPQTKGIIVPQGGGLLRVRVLSYTSGASTGTIRVSNTPQQVFFVSLLDGQRATYSCATAPFTPAASATDIFIITGSATKTIRVLKIEIYATQSTAGVANIFLVKRSTANTGGTFVTGTKVPHDSNFAAATATVGNYTASPTLGTLVGNIKIHRGMIPATATALNNPIATWTFGNASGGAIVLRGTNELLAVNLNGVTISGGVFVIRVEWTEE